MRINSQRAFGHKTLRHSGLGQKTKDNLRKGVKAGIVGAAILGGIVAGEAGIAHQQEKQHEENKSNLLGNLKPMDGPIEKSPAFEGMPDVPILKSRQGALMAPAPAVAAAGAKEIGVAAARAVVGVVAGGGKAEAVKAVARVASAEPKPEGHNIVNQIRDVEVAAAHGSSRVVGSEAASIKDLSRIGKNKIKGKFKRNK